MNVSTVFLFFVIAFLCYYEAHPPRRIVIELIYFENEFPFMGDTYIYVYE